MIPSTRLLLFGLALAATAIIPTVWSQWTQLWWILPALLCMAMIIDAVIVRRAHLTAERQVRQVLPHQQWSDVGLVIENDSRLSLQLIAYDMHPQSCNTRGLPSKAKLAVRSKVTMRYELMPTSRGDIEFNGIDCHIKTKLGLWTRQVTLPCDTVVQVYPNFKANRLFGLLLSKQHLNHLGIRRLPRPGEGSDFHQLREYRDGDSLRQIDWKATARTQKLIAREYAQERDQQIVFMLDCSMRMRHQEGISSHMDDTLNAIVLLAHVALQQGDATGIMTFGGVDRWIPPAKGIYAARRLMQGLYDVQATKQLPDYVQAVETLSTRLRRRALVILITNSRNEDGQSALQALQRLKGKHLVLVADLREADLDNAINTNPQTTEEAILWMSAENYRLERQQRHRLATAGGARLLDVTPANLSADLITRYLAIKRMGQL